jgi:acyl-CoA thioester hydrolase
MDHCDAQVRVRYAETDQMGVVYHSNYLVWMEVGRVELCRSRGIPYQKMEADGVLLAVAEVGCRYLSPARYDDEVVVHTRIEEAGPRMVRFGYEMRCEGRLLATGFSKHVFLDRSMRPKRLPSKYFALFGLPEPGPVAAETRPRPGV